MEDEFKEELVSVEETTFILIITVLWKNDFGSEFGTETLVGQVRANIVPFQKIPAVPENCKVEFGRKIVHINVPSGAWIRRRSVRTSLWAGAGEWLCGGGEKGRRVGGERAEMEVEEGEAEERGEDGDQRGSNLGIAEDGVVLVRREAALAEILHHFSVLLTGWVFCVSLENFQSFKMGGPKKQINK